MPGNDFVNDSIFGQQAQEMSGAPPNQPGAAPYPLYGIPAGMGEVGTPFHLQPWFAYPAGVAIGVGLGWAFFGWFKPKYMKASPKKKGG